MRARAASAALILVLPASSSVAAREVVGLPSPNMLVIAGAGYAPPWDTDIEFANGKSGSVEAVVSGFPGSLSPCLSCPEWQVSIPPGGTAHATAELALTAFGMGLPAIRALYVVPLTGPDPPTVTARVVNRARPTQTIELPVIRYSTLEALNPSVLAFPSATRTSIAHTNLILTEATFFGTLSGTLEVFSSDGVLLGSGTFEIGPNRHKTLFLMDVLMTLGVSNLENGQIRVTKTGGDGLLWGVLATVHDDGRVSVSPGLNP
jgi:hypothetical protein